MTDGFDIHRLPRTDDEVAADGPPLRVAHFITGLMSGGAEAMLVKTALRARVHGIEPVVVSLMQGGAMAAPLRAMGVPLIELGLARSWWSLAALPRLPVLGRAVEADLFQGWMYHGNVMASLARLGGRRRVPVLWNVRQRLESLADEVPRTRAVIRVSRRLAQQPAAIVYNLEAAAEDHERLLGYPATRRVVIGNGFDCEAFRPDPAARAATRARWGVAEETLLLGRVARWHPMKDIPTLLAAFAPLAAAEPRLALALVGRGMEPGNAELAALVARHGLGGRVLPRGEERDLAAVTPAFDIAVSSSSHGEGFPNVIGEAMACGVPVVTTDVGASAAVLGDPARVVPPRDPAALAAVLRRLLALPPAALAALGAADRARVSAEYGLAAVTAAYARLWRRVAAARQG